MRATNVVVLVIDRLGAGWLGPYGNTWLDTPNFNRLAARSVMWETVLAESPDLAVSCHSFWTGRHAMEPDAAASGALPHLAAAAGATPVLVTDDREVADHPLAAGFSARHVVPVPPASVCVENIEQTGLFAVFDVARSILGERDGPQLLWLHSRGMGGPWDAPLALRYQFADEEDPEPPHLVEPPEVHLDEAFDPDMLLGFVHAYAGQVALADMCLGMLLNALDEDPPGDETLLIVTSPRGYPLGEHRRVGPCDEALYGELLHVPLFVRFPANDLALMRSQRISQSHEVYPLIAESCGWQTGRDQASGGIVREFRGDELHSLSLTAAIGPGQRAIRTPAWFMRQSHQHGETRRELFAKPDDRWEGNEVSSRCDIIVELLAAELDRFEAAARDGRLAETAPLAEPLCDTWR
jgi:arylsulfatase A-like enzyme